MQRYCSVIARIIKVRRMTLTVRTRFNIGHTELSYLTYFCDYYIMFAAIRCSQINFQILLHLSTLPQCHIFLINVFHFLTQI